MLFLIRLALPTPPERIRPIGTTDEDLARFVRSTIREINPPAGNSKASAFGELLFRDNDFLPYLPGRSARNESCAGCHGKGGSSTTFLTSDRHAPDLTRTSYYTSFGSTGRTRSLGSFIASHLESRSELGSSRVRIVRMMFAKYRTAYEAAFGALPAIDPADLPEDGTPSLDLLEFPIPVSSFILETMKDRDQLQSLLTQAQTEHLAPAVIVSRTVFLPRLPENSFTEQFYRLPADTQQRINLVFNNVVKALSTYVLGQTQPESPYDRFAVKIAAGAMPAEALSPEFGNEELTGLRLFHGPAGCARCHNGPGFTDNSFHNIGLPAASLLDAGHATGLALSDYKEDCTTTAAYPPSPFPTIPVCPTEEQRTQLMINAVGAFRTPSLRGNSSGRLLTHNGQIESPEDMLTFYSRLDDRPAIGRRSALLAPLNLTKEERSALNSFIVSLGLQSSSGMHATLQK